MTAKQTFPTPKEQANNLLNVISNGDHPLRPLALETVTVEQFIHLVELSEREVRV